MGLKKQLGMGVVSAALGLTLMGGGTYAYFSDSETSNNTFAAGTLDLSAEPSTVINVDDIQPSDSMTRDFELKNEGTLDIKNVSLDSDYDVIDAQGDNTGDFGKQIQVAFLYNADQAGEVIYETTLDKLKDMSPDAVKKEVFDELIGEDGLEAGDTDDMVVKFKFLNKDKEQNQFQGDKLKLEWTFNAEQTTNDEEENNS